MRTRLLIAVVLVIKLSAISISAQQTGDAIGPGQIPGAAKTVSSWSGPLSYEQAIQLGIQNNLATLLTRERRNESRGVKQQALSQLLPNVSGAAYQASLTENLAALGLTPGAIPGFPTFVGPFKNFDARVLLVQNIFDLSAIKNYQASKSGERLAQLEVDLAREQVASGVGLNYLEALRAERAVAAAEANVELAKSLLKQTQDQRNAGVATGVDVIRAQTRLAEQEVNLAQAQTIAEQARLNLQRVVGLPLGTTFTLSDRLQFVEEPLPEVDAAVTDADQNRREVQVARERTRVSKLEFEATRSEYVPTVQFIGDYGVSAITPRESAFPTRRAAIQLNVPIFTGGRIRGRTTEAKSRQQQTELELANVRGQVEEDVRLALVTLRTAAVQVRAAEQNLTLALRELEMSRDRFVAGVADNLEVVTAQTALADARNAQVTALAQHNAARLNLAAAVGRAESFRW